MAIGLGTAGAIGVVGSAALVLGMMTRHRRRLALGLAAAPLIPPAPPAPSATAIPINPPSTPGHFRQMLRHVQERRLRRSRRSSVQVVHVVRSSSLSHLGAAAPADVSLSFSDDEQTSTFPKVLTPGCRRLSDDGDVVIRMSDMNNDDEDETGL